ncbi:uncharacterized protein UTRI_02075_B [Ustilago trichophora]|uniref:Peptidase S9 prolyl oligopeptidase catalytic domain-containing protein n=1 Tax=Ustilago trichophora TaxID=86804 RepID=A0A5C3DUC1_9BASI|nr:uncharacterized protein UTRI_02075_B [Ustilago trichophora]
MLRNRFQLCSLMALLVTATVSTQQVFQSEQPRVAPSSMDAAIFLDKTWQVLGPFPAGMRELPFGGFTPSVTSSYAELLDPQGQNRYFSTFGPTNATTILQSFDAQVQTSERTHIKQSLTVEYPNVDWPWIRKSAGWSSLQWQMMAVTDLTIGQNNTALAITMDKTAEFAILPKNAFSANSMRQMAIEWHTGDWYLYIAAFSKEGDIAPELPISHHLLHLDQGAYKLLVRSMYEIRIFGDPRNNGGAESPKMTVGIDVAVRGLPDIAKEEMVEIHTDPHHSNVPHVVGGWVAGWGLSFAVRNLDPNNTYTLRGVDMVADTVHSPLQAELGHELRVAPRQTVVVPVKLTQSSALDANVTFLNLSLRLSAALDSDEARITKAVRIPLTNKLAFWEASSNDDDHNAYMYSYLAPDHSVQLAAATPPKRSGRILTQNGTLPPLIVTLHGAGVDLRDLFFSNSIRRQMENWSILPTGRTPWGYDWQLASLEAADAAVSAFHKHLYGLPTTMSEEERQTWQFDPNKLFIMGHSNGGQGAWYRLSRFPDRVIGGMVGSAYTKVSDYVSFAWKVGRHFVDPVLQGILHSGVTMFENDLFASNLAGLDLLVKFGSADANVPPWNSKDMAMVVDGWNQRSGLKDKVKISEIPGRPHWWDTLFSEDDVQGAIEAACLSSKNPGYEMPDAPQNFTLTVFNPAESGSKGGWRISEVELPGRLAKLEVQYKADTLQDGVDSKGHVKVASRNTRRIELDLTIMRRSSFAAASLGNATLLRISLNGQDHEAEIGGTDKIHFVQREKGDWTIITEEELSADSRQTRPIGPLLRIVTSEGPMVLVIPSEGPTAEVSAWRRVAERFAADLLLHGSINSQILTDADLDSISAADHLKHSNIVTLGGPNINSYTRANLDSWPKKSPIHFPSPESSAQFEIQGRIFSEEGTAMVTLAPHPSYAEGLALVVHGIGADGVSRAARLLPTRTATMIPEWVVTDGTAEWMGEGGVQAAGWYDREWGWSESMSYIQ